MNRRDALKTIAGAGAALAPEYSTASAENPVRSARIAHFTDAHVYASRGAPQGLASAIRHVHALDDRPDFVLNGGDAIYDALEATREDAKAQWSLWKAAWKENGDLPMRHCLGNHDIWGWNKARSGTSGSEAGWGKQLALDQLELEKSYYRFDAGAWRLIVLDTMTFDEQGAYRADLGPEQRDWLAAELKATPAETPVAIVSHIPILTVGTVGFTPELRQHPHVARMLSLQDAYEILQILRGHPNVKLCLSGHTHQTEAISYAGIDFVNSGAVSGLWWKGKFHHTDEGYNVIDLYDDGTFRTSYMAYGWKAQS